MITVPRLRQLLAGLSAVPCALAGGSALAQSPTQGWLDRRFAVDLGTFVIGTELKASLNGEVSTDNEEVDFDETFGLGKDVTRWRVDALWRIAPRHQLRFAYFDTSSARTETIDGDIEWGDYVFTAGGEVTAEFEARVYILSYEYAFVRDPRYEIAAVLGLHHSELSLALSGNAKLTDASGRLVDQGNTSQAASASAPLPMIGLRGTWVASQNWVLEAAAAAFAARYDIYDGTWYQLRAGATWMFNPHFGVGVAAHHFRTDVEIAGDSFDGRLKTSYTGLQVYATAAF